MKFKLIFPIIIIIALAVGIYLFKNPTPQSQVACDMDARTCPDGSIVGRVTPTCEFSPCPSGQALTGWETHSSARHKYSFKYPPIWTIYKYQEDNPAVYSGAHTLHSYDVNNVEKYMNHGAVDWEKFMPSGTALKLDITVGALEKAAREDHLKQITESSGPGGSGIQSASTDLKIGNLETIRFSYPESGNRETSVYLAYPNDNQIVQIGVYVFYSSETDFRSTQEWKNLLGVFSSFKFNQ